MDRRQPPFGAEDKVDFDVLIVGAGIAGIGAACRLTMDGAARSIIILERRETLGGTWDLFRFPGVRTDSDMTTLGFPFRPWRGDRSLVEGDEIRRYIAEVTVEFGINRLVRYRHRVIAATWSSAEARWTVRAEKPDGPVDYSCRFLYSCCGYFDYDRGHAPTWPGMERFTGPIIHPQFWPDTLNVAGKRVVVIGSGSTAVTLVPALARNAASVVMLQRSPSYVIAQPSRDRHGIAIRRVLPASLADRIIRWKNVAFTTLVYRYARSRPAKMRSLIRAGVQQALGPDYEVDRHFKPSYQPWDQRLCVAADGDLFNAIRSGRASIVTDQISRFLESGIELASGQTLTADIVVSATGLSLQAFGGIALTVNGQAVDPAQRVVYKGSMLEAVPNFLFAFGYSNASWTLKCDLTARFACRLLRHMARRRWDSVVPRLCEADVEREPMTSLTSGYVTRSEHAMPKRGPAPWRAGTNYFTDAAAIWTSRLHDGVLQFARRAPPPALEP